jgi:hypothetical protein
MAPANQRWHSVAISFPLNAIYEALSIWTPNSAVHSTAKAMAVMRAMHISSMSALTHSRNDEDTLKAARRSLLCFDADSFFPIPPVASIRIFALVR